MRTMPTEMDLMTVHVVYFPKGEELYSKGKNVTGSSFSECIIKFEQMDLGEVFNATLKD